MSPTALARCRPRVGHHWMAIVNFLTIANRTNEFLRVVQHGFTTARLWAPLEYQVPTQCRRLKAKRCRARLPGTIRGAIPLFAILNTNRASPCTVEWSQV